MAPSLLTVPDEIFHQICEEVLGGNASLDDPVWLEFLQPACKYGAVGRSDLYVFYACRKLNTVLRSILYNKQLYRIFIQAAGTNELEED
jgi:hypothetical protein